MNRSELGSQSLNLRLQEVLNPATGTARECSVSAGRTAPATRSCRHGTITRRKFSTATSAESPPSRKPSAKSRSSTTVGAIVYDFGELDELNLSFAVTIHKAQGSEYPAVVIPLHTQHFVMLQRNLLYTGVTRGKKLVVLVGNRKALEMAVQRQDTSRRYSALRRRLQEDSE